MALNTSNTDGTDLTSAEQNATQDPDRAAGPSGDVERLACGRRLDDVFDHADSPPDAHEQDCPFCQNARSSLQALNEATDRLRVEDEADPTLQLNPSRLTAIMDIARAEVRRGRRIPLHYTAADRSAGPANRTEASLMISEQTIAGVIRHAGDQIPGLETRRCFIELADRVSGPDAAKSGAPSTIRARVTVSVSATVAIPALMADLRARAGEAVLEEIGIRLSVLDVEVQDLYDAA